MKRLIFALFTVSTANVLADATGSSDSEFLDRYTSSVIVSYGEISGSHDFLYGPVDKIKRDVSFENAVRFNALGQKITYEMPRGVSRERATQWFKDQLDELGANLLFSCDGPDCGRATIWASQIFRVRELSAPDREQSYNAYTVQLDDSQVLIALYVVERGNKRVIAHIEEVKPQETVYFDENSGFVDQLTANGMAIIQGIEPNRDGSLPETASATLSMIGQQLEKVVAQDIYIVCHLRAAGSPEDLINSSQACADAVSAQLAEQTSRNFTGLGVGPLVPVVGRQHSRVEVVIPNLLRQVSHQ